MRTVKWSALLPSLCGVAVALGMMTASAHAVDRKIVSTGLGSSIIAFPKVLAEGAVDTTIQVTNISNNMVHARCFYVNAAKDDFGRQQWQVTDFLIWFTKQQPTSWQVSTGRFVNPYDNCEIVDGFYVPSADCPNAGLDPGAIPPVPLGFIGELKCIEVDESDNPLGGNHLKGEATIKVRGTGDVAKYNAIGIQGTELAGETGNELLLNQPWDSDDPVGQYAACPNVLIVNHFAEGATDPVVLDNLAGGFCDLAPLVPCQDDAICELVAGPLAVCVGGPQILEPGVVPPVISLRSATITDLTLVPCSQNFEDPFAFVEQNEVTVQFLIFNEYEQQFSASTTIRCWKNFHLFEVDSPNNPNNSVFSYAILGTLGVETRVIPNPEDGAVIGVTGMLRADRNFNVTRTLVNTHMEGDRFSGSEGQIVDKIILSGQ